MLICLEFGNNGKIWERGMPPKPDNDWEDIGVSTTSANLLMQTLRKEELRDELRTLGVKDEEFREV